MSCHGLQIIRNCSLISSIEVEEASNSETYIFVDVPTMIDRRRFKVRACDDPLWGVEKKRTPDTFDSINE